MRLLADLDQYIPNRDADRNPRAKYTPPADVGPLLPAHIRYLKNRRLDPDELVRDWHVAGIGIAAQLQWRIFVPVIANERLSSWTTRALGPDVQPRYISASPDQEAVPIKSTIFGLDFVRNSAVVCEGPFDAMAIGRGAVAVFGLKWSHEQVLKLSRVPVRFICFDADPGAQQRAQKLAADLSLLPGCTHIIEIQSGKDPAECSDDEKTEIRKLLE
jgi:DNA primase